MGNERFHISHSKPHMVVNFYQSSHIFQREGENLYPAFIQCVTPITFHLNLFFMYPSRTPQHFVYTSAIKSTQTGV